MSAQIGERAALADEIIHQQVVMPASGYQLRHRRHCIGSYERCREALRRAATFVDKAIGFTIPQSILLRVDRVIE